jgi:hypothetical protein
MTYKTLTPVRRAVDPSRQTTAPTLRTAREAGDAPLPTRID